MNFFNTLKNKKITGSFAIISFITGFIFIDKTITANAILESPQIANLSSLIALALFLCSILLTYYTLK